MIHEGTFTKVSGGWDDVWGYRIVGSDAVNVGDEITMTTKAGKVSTVFVRNVQGIERSAKFGASTYGEFSKTPVAA